MWFEVFVLFSPLWWVLSIATFIVMIWAISHDRHAGKLATFVISVYTLFLVLLGDFRPWEWIAKNPLDFVLKTVGYVVVGGIWAAIYWYIRCLHKRSEYNDTLTRWLLEQGVPENQIGKIPTVPNNLKKEWTDYVLHSYEWSRTKYVQGEEITYIQIVPLIRDHKTEFALAWLAWPVVMFWPLFDDILRAIGTTLYEFIGRRLQYFANLAFRGTEDHFVQEGENKEEK
jgi:hypothetical protein